jgi:signal transduction histidine kinase
MLKVMGASPKDDKVTVVALMPAAPLRKELVDYSWRILGLSIVISLLTASLVFVVLQAQIVAPMLRLTVNMVRFRPDREADGVSAPASRRSDEVGIAERTLIGMQEQLRTAFRQQAHLAALGSAVSKISHDLRNILSTVRLLSDRLANSDDPEVRRITPRLVAGVDRAVNLTQATLDFTADRPKLRRQRFALAELLSEVVADFAGDGSKGQAERRFDIEVPAGLTLDADRDQLFRALTNITRNATEAGANSLTYKHIRQERAVVLEIADDGPGVPEALRANLFDPFTSARPGGTGLGLAIARDLVQAHGGTVDLVSTGEGGSVFRVSLPDRY